MWLMKKFGEKLRDWFGSDEPDEESVYDYISVNRNGKLYVDDVEGYLEAGNCFEEMKRLEDEGAK